MKVIEPEMGHRRSVRLKGYDYSVAGIYFITVCVQRHVCLLGEIVGDGKDAQMVLNGAGEMVKREWARLEERFPHVKCGSFVVMPNHFYAILETDPASLPVGTPLRTKTTKIL